MNDVQENILYTYTGWTIKMYPLFESSITRLLKVVETYTQSHFNRQSKCFKYVKSHVNQRNSLFTGRPKIRVTSFVVAQKIILKIH